MALPAWLGPLIGLSDYGGDPRAYLDALYGVFTADFITTPATFRGKRIVFDDRVTYQGKVECFWHITSSDDPAQERSPDMRRCERVGWIKAVINNSTDPQILTWETVRGGKTRANLFLEEDGFLVVLQDDKKHCVLITAIYIEYQSHRHKLRKEYEAYVQNSGKTPPTT